MIKYIEDITFSRVDVNFIFECSTRYLRSERSKRVRYRVEHERLDERFRTFSEDYQRLPKLPTISEDGPMMFRSHISVLFKGDSFLTL